MRSMITAALCVALLPAIGPARAEEPMPIGDRRELFVDDALIERLTGGATLRLHPPQARNVALRTDKPWEGNACHYRTVFRDGDVVRMYYQTGHYRMGGTAEKATLTRPNPAYLCYAESHDGGVTFIRPNLGLYEFDGSKDNNILFDGNAFKDSGYVIIEAGVSVFKDTRPACPADERYKAVAIARAPGSRSNAGLLALKSPDGMRWSLMADAPVITDGKFDSQNLAFYDAVRGEYRAYHRDFLRGVRGIKTQTSADMVTWSKAQWLDYGDAPPTPLYTNQIAPYYRAPHIYLGFPMRYTERAWSQPLEALPGPQQRRMRSSVANRFGATVTDSLFMASRDGVRFRRYDEAFIRPRGGDANWTYGDNSIAWGLIETPPDVEHAHRELSMYVVEGYWVGEHMNVRRYAMRIDGFVSVNAPMRGGEVVTKPFTFTGDRLTLNLATSAAGDVRVEVQDAAGKPIAGYALEDCPPVFGDHLDHAVHWGGGPDVGDLAGRAVRLRLVLRDADLYAFRFATASPTGAP